MKGAGNDGRPRPATSPARAGSRLASPPEFHASVLASVLGYARENLKLSVISPEEALIWIEETDPLFRPIVEAN